MTKDMTDRHTPELLRALAKTLLSTCIPAEEDPKAPDTYQAIVLAQAYTLSASADVKEVLEIVRRADTCDTSSAEFLKKGAEDERDEALAMLDETHRRAMRYARSTDPSEARKSIIEYVADQRGLSFAEALALGESS